MIIYTYPEYPHPQSTFNVICLHAGHQLSGMDGDVIFWYEDSTYQREERLEGAINGRARDIDKYTVGIVFEEVFGYPLLVNPLQLDGETQIVMKSLRNAAHDGQVIRAKNIKEIHPERVYQKYLNPVEEDYYEYRIVVYDYDIVCVWLNYKPSATRFGWDQLDRSELVEIKDAFSQYEIFCIKKFTRFMNSEFCEIDAIRDTDGKLYIVDHNLCPWGPSPGLSEEDFGKVMELLIPSFNSLCDKFK